MTTIETLSGIFGVGATAVGLWQLRALFRKKKGPGDGSWPWLQRTPQGYFRCPKCTRENGTNCHTKLCDCGERVTPHFHFTCGACDFKAVMRTADEGVKEL